MRGLALNLLLAFVWALFAGEVSTRELLVGFGLGFAILSLFPGTLGTAPYVGRTLATLRFLGYFLKELTVANVHVALYALRPHPRLNPMIVAYPLRLRGDSHQTLLAAVVGLMPGSVSLGFNAGRTVMYSHVIGTATPQAARDSIRRTEDALLPVLGLNPQGEPLTPTPKEAKP